MNPIQIILFSFILIMLALSVVYSFRYRRETDTKKRGVLAARMNICMGIMLVIIAVTQLFFFSDSSFRRIFGTICLLLGLFNMFAGIRNHGHFSRMNR